MIRSLYRGDCLNILEDQIEPESIDLVYLDPPFNSKTTYNLPFKGKDKTHKAVEAFKDTWTWQDTPDESGANDNDRLEALRNDIKLGDIASLVDLTRKQDTPSNSMGSYILSMTYRLNAIRRVLKPTGSVYLHCDPTANYVLRMIMDCVFERDNFRNEIVWERIKGAGKQSQHAPRHFGRCSDSLFWYSKTDEFQFNSNAIKIPYSEEYLEDNFPHWDSKGRYKRRNPFRPPGLGPRPNLCYEYKGFTPPHPSGWTAQKSTLQAIDAKGDLEITPDGKIYRKQRPEGMLPNNIWTDIPQAAGNERLGYPTQKPLALLERIIKASSKPGDIVLDPFCGCGTAVHAAESLGRQWVGVDISRFAIGLINERILTNFQGILDPKDIGLYGQPETVTDAHRLAQTDRFEFEKWACGKIGAHGMAARVGEPGADGGIDGIIEFWAIQNGKPKKHTAIVQVKSGHVTADSVRALDTVVRRSGSVSGIMLCFADKMRTVENQKGNDTWSDDYQTYPVIQGFSIEDLLVGKRPNLPPLYGTRRGGNVSSISR